MTNEIKVCMGSACFAKGNQENLEAIKQYIEDNNLEADITITGSLCENKCDKGPRIIVNNMEYTNVTSKDIMEILKKVKEK